MFDAVSFDVGGGSANAFSVADAAGLKPLTLPKEFLGGLGSRQPSADAVLRFENAMGDAGLAAANDALRASLSVAPAAGKSESVPREPAASAATVPSAMPGLEVAAPVVAIDEFATAPAVPGAVQEPAEGAATAVPASEKPSVAPESLPAAPALPSDVAAVQAADRPMSTSVSDAVAVDVVPEKPAASVVTPQAPVAETPAPVAVEAQAEEAAPAVATVAEKPASTVGKQASVAEKPASAVGKAAAPAASEEADVREPDVVAAAAAAAPHVVVNAPAAAEVAAPQASPAVSAVSAVSARTEVILDAVNKIVDAVVGEISVTPSLVAGEGVVRITLKPDVLDGSGISLTAKDGTLTVAVTPATVSAEQLAAAALPRLEIALAEHAPAFRHVEVALVAKKGRTDEVA